MNYCGLSMNNFVMNNTRRLKCCLFLQLSRLKDVLLKRQIDLSASSLEIRLVSPLMNATIIDNELVISQNHFVETQSSLENQQSNKKWHWWPHAVHIFQDGHVRRYNSFYIDTLYLLRFVGENYFLQIIQGCLCTSLVLPGTRYQAPGAWYLIPGTWCTCYYK